MSSKSLKMKCKKWARNAVPLALLLRAAADSQIMNANRRLLS